jgi:serine/threonine protein kinase
LALSEFWFCVTGSVDQYPLPAYTLDGYRLRLRYGLSSQVFVGYYTLHLYFVFCICLILCLSSASPPILHRDLKAENLLVDANWTVKVIITPSIAAFVSISCSFLHLTWSKRWLTLASLVTWARNRPVGAKLPLCPRSRSTWHQMCAPLSLIFWFYFVIWCQVGSIRYCAPELLTVDNLALYNEQADVYVANLSQTYISTENIHADILLE